MKTWGLCNIYEAKRKNNHSKILEINRNNKIEIKVMIEKIIVIKLKMISQTYVSRKKILNNQGILH